MATIRRGEVWLVNLNPQEHPEEPAKNDRPCLVMQEDQLNAAGYTSTVIIPCTTNVYRDGEGDGFPLKVALGLMQKPGEAQQETDALITAIRAVSNRRFKGDKPIAIVGRSHMKRIENALKLVLGM